MFIKYNSFNIIFLIIFISLFLLYSQNQRTISSLYFPNILTLLNHKIIMVAQDGIHYFNSDLTNEDFSKKVIFEKQIESNDMNSKTAIAQFSSEEGGYIIVLALDIIYFLDSEGLLINSKNLSNSIDGEHYCVTPYKNENYKLHYIITFPISDKNYKNFTMIYYIYNIKDNSNNERGSKIIRGLVESTNTNPSSLTGVTCLLLSHPSINNNIITCFYSVSYGIEIHSKSFDPEKGLDEITYLSHYYHNSSETRIISYISAVTNENKQKIFIYYLNIQPFYLIFDFDNYFSQPIAIIEEINYSVMSSYYLTKLFYIRQTHEIICTLSYNSNCRKLIMIFNKEFTFKGKIEISPTECYNTFS